MLVAATLLLIGVFVASMLSESAVDELAVLYALPVMLIGLELGVRGGVSGAAIASVLLLVESGSHSELGSLGLAASATVFLAAGALAGRFSTRMRSGQRRQARLLSSGLRLARLEDFDALPRVLAEELEHAVDLSSLRVELHGAPPVEVGNPAGETSRFPISAHGIGFGSLTLSAPAGRSFTAEDLVVASKLALHAAVAADNQRLLASEHERAALRAELEHTRRRLASQVRNVSKLLDSQDSERREIARQLHEQAAQAMTAVLLGLQVLERDLDHELTRRQLEEVGCIVRETLADLRQLAVSVRPPSLDDLGLRAALEGIAEREGPRTPRRIALHCDDRLWDLAPEVETCAYYLVEETTQALDGPLDVRVQINDAGDSLRIELTAHEPGHDEQLPARLATVRARLELIGGTLEMSSSGTPGIVAEVPLRGIR